MSQPAGWVLYRARTGEPRWHYWPHGSDCTLCGKARRVDRVDETARDPAVDSHPVCTVCRERRHHPDDAQMRSGTRKRSTSRHEPNCACEHCRGGRRQGARRFMEQIAEDAAEIACSCVRRAVKEGAWGEPEIPEILQGAEDKLMHRLFLWELTGGTAECQDAGEARTVLLECWKRVVEIFNVRGEEHRCQKC